MYHKNIHVWLVGWFVCSLVGLFMFYHAMKNEPFITYLASAAPGDIMFFSASSVAARSCLLSVQCKIIIVLLRKNTARISMKFAEGSHRHEQIKWFYFVRSWNRDKGYDRIFDSTSRRVLP